MSKAFTRESDDAPVPPPSWRRDDLPVGAPSYLTVTGAARLRDELDHLVRDPDASPQRIQELTDHLAAAEIVDPTAGDPHRVRFGATVTVRDDDDHEMIYRIVGIPEADPRHGAVSWVSPVAHALLGASVGDTVTLRTVRGTHEHEIVAISYEP